MYKYIRFNFPLFPLTNSFIFISIEESNRENTEKWQRESIGVSL